MNRHRADEFGIFSLNTIVEFGGKTLDKLDYVDDLWCKIYVDADISRDELVGLVARIAGGSRHGRTIRTGLVDVPISVNDEFDEIRRKEPGDGFLYFRYYMDVEAFPDQPRAAQIALVSRLLQHFWAQGWPAGAACDYEDELPTRSEQADF